MKRRAQGKPRCQGLLQAAAARCLPTAVKGVEGQQAPMHQPAGIAISPLAWAQTRYGQAGSGCRPACAKAEASTAAAAPHQNTSSCAAGQGGAMWAACGRVLTVVVAEPLDSAVWMLARTCSIEWVMVGWQHRNGAASCSAPAQEGWKARNQHATTLPTVGGVQGQQLAEAGAGPRTALALSASTRRVALVGVPATATQAGSGPLLSTEPSHLQHAITWRVVK